MKFLVRQFSSVWWSPGDCTVYHTGCSARGCLVCTHTMFWLCCRWFESNCLICSMSTFEWTLQLSSFIQLLKYASFSVGFLSWTLSFTYWSV